MQVQNDDDLHGGQRSHGVKYNKLCSMVTKLGQTISYDNDDLPRGQRSTDVKCTVFIYVTWLPHLIRYTANTR